MKPNVSIIIVYYRAKEELMSCLSSIAKSQQKVSYEVIVVDNDERQTIEKELKQRYPSATYVRSPGNIGFGAGNNMGAKHASGKYLLFLNPDTLVLNNAIETLAHSLKQEKKIGIITPQLLGEDRHIDLLQCTGSLTPTSGLVAHSILNKLSPNNPISRKYWMLEWGRRTKREVEVVQGAAFMVKKSLFDDLGGFDEKFFMYFEESDFCLRVRKKGWKIVFEPKAKIVHFGKRSTKDRRKALKIFKKSRSYYFKKHFGLLKGIITQFLFWLMEQWKLTAVIIALFLTIFMSNIFIK